MAPKKELEIIPEGELVLCQFAGNEVRKVCHNDEWFFSIVDVIGAITGSSQPSRYWADLKTKLSETEGASQLFDRIEKLPIEGADGRSRAADTGNTETIFRIVQSIASPKAEPFKRWLAKVGYERIQEAQNPSIAIKRAIVDYQMQGRTLDWVEARLKTLVSRKELTDHWKETGIKEHWEYAVLTNEISKGTFGLEIKDHAQLKGLGKNHNLRDNMTRVELILTMLGETATKEISKARKALGFSQNKGAAQSGGSVAGNARLDLEKQLGHTVISSENNLAKLPPSEELLKLPTNFEESVKRISPVKKGT
jgi:DNA-damage-inducible protein D